MAKPKHSLDLGEQLCFSLYTAQRLVTAAYRPILDALGLTYSQYVAMLALWESAPMTMGELGTRLGLDYGTVTPLVKRLESAGLVAPHAQHRGRADGARDPDRSRRGAAREGGGHPGLDR